MKRTLLVAATALCLAVTPAYAVGPLAAILIGYAKQAIKERITSYAKGKLMGALSENLKDVPGAGLLGLVPGAAGVAPRPSLPAETMASLQSSGVCDKDARPLTDAEWKEYGDEVTRMAKAAGAGAEDTPDIAEMRAQVAQAPELSGMVRASLNQFRSIRAEQARMRELYARMPEGERAEVVAEMLKTVRDLPEDERPQARDVLLGDALGLHEDLRKRLAAALS